MKQLSFTRLALALAVACFLSLPVAAAAQTTITSSEAKAKSASGAASLGNYTSIESNAPPPSIPDRVPDVIPPALTTTLSETCMGSSSAGGSGVGFGISLGTTWTDENCVRRLNARQMAALGDQNAAKELLCDDPKMAAAYARAGKPCAATRAAAKKAAALRAEREQKLALSNAQRKRIKEQWAQEQRRRNASIGSQVSALPLPEITGEAVMVGSKGYAKIEGAPDWCSWNSPQNIIKANSSWRQCFVEIPEESDEVALLKQAS